MRRTRAVLITFITAAALLLAGAGSGAAGPGSWWEPTDRPASDSEINVSGEPFKGTDANGDVRGFLEAHNHVFSNEGFGGKMICGKVFDPAGIAEALQDCPEHYPNGEGAIFEHLTGGDSGTHDPVGYPTFSHWPNPTSLSHQQNYYAWMERAWRGGVRIMVNDLVTNGLICSLLPRDRSCDEMTSIRLQAQKSHELEAYIDDMYGGPGKGWLRIVTTPEEARQVVEQGKMAMVLGAEMSEPFGCKQILGVAQCSKADIDRGLDEFQELGISSAFLCHKFDNALCGVRFDKGLTGVAVNAGQFMSTGTWWQTEKCRTSASDNPISNADLTQPMRDVFTPDPPNYDRSKRCNTRGLTELGEYALKGMMKRGMMVEMDHMSVKAAGRTLDLLEEAGYPGAVSTHSWMEPQWHERVYALGGLIAQYGAGHDHEGTADFVAEWQREEGLRAKYDKAYAFGTDMNGVGGTNPAGTGAPVSYPFSSFDGGSTLDRQVTGDKTWDINTDGVAHYGLVPDWIEELRQTAGQDIVDDLSGGAQMYLDTWGATRGWAQQANLARGKSASASSTEWAPFGGLAPRRAVDGDLSSRWASGWSDHQWLRVDLGSKQQVGRVAIYWEAAHARDFDVQVSNDGNTWQTVGQVRDGDGEIDVVSFSPRQARHVRVLMSRRATSYGYSVHELRVFAG
jgi:microsomal dipeptidase-like Zn-dependent dipeptidase